MVFLTLAIARADFFEVFRLGLENGTMNVDRDFENQSSGASNEIPGSAQAQDDDYYIAGSYPAPIGTITSDEAIENFEGNLHRDDPRVRVHFPADGEPELTRYFLSFSLIWRGYWVPSEERAGETVGNHEFAIRHNGTLLETIRLPFSKIRGEFHVVFAGIESQVSGFGYIEIEHLGGTTHTGDPFPENYWASIDYMELRADPVALTDDDDDGLPLYWESQYGMSDRNASDAASDVDQDGLTASQEYELGTSAMDEDTDDDGLIDGLESDSDPLVQDSDDDGLTDAQEVLGEVASSPSLVDSDEDGASDTLELAKGTDPLDASSLPDFFDGSIAINFTSAYHSKGFLQDSIAAGAVPQLNWNQTQGLSSETAQGDTGNILLPVTGKIVDAAGVETNVSVNWNAANIHGYTAESGNVRLPAHRLLRGMLYSYDWDGIRDDGVEVSLSNVPFQSYDIIAYTHALSGYRSERITLNNDLNSARVVASYFNGGRLDDFVETKEYGEGQVTKGNYVRFRNVTGSSFSLMLDAIDGGAELGLTALQVVDMAADDDGDGMPNGWEWEHNLDLGSAADATMDLDGDGLSNSDEFVVRTDPRDADSDGDGLSDKVETGTGNYVGIQDTGTNPHSPDSDGDRISDFEELFGDGFLTDPNSLDTDGDGVSDYEERFVGVDPTDPSTGVIPLPIFSESEQKLTWTIENIRMLVDYSNGRTLATWGGGSAFSITAFSDEGSGVRDTLGVAIEFNAGKWGYKLDANAESAFFHPDSGSNYLSLAHWRRNGGNPAPDDIGPAIGLSGLADREFSNRIRFVTTAYRESAGVNSWTVTFDIYNQDTDEVIVSLSQTGAIASAEMNSGSVSWQDREGRQRSVLTTQQSGIEVFFSASSADDLGFLERIRDTDGDGLLNSYEIEHELNPDDPDDANLDTDEDGLDNLAEQWTGTDPREKDTDGDSISDFWEVKLGMGAVDRFSAPDAFRFFSGGTGEDFDGDGVSDLWEVSSGLLDMHPNADEDGDGYSNLTEKLLGSDYGDEQSKPEVRLARTRSGFELSWPDSQSEDFRLEHSLDFENWSKVFGELENDSRVKVLDDREFGEYGYYRLGVAAKLEYPQSFVDSDGDGVSSWAEALFGMSDEFPNSSRGSVMVDTDLDGVPDSEESGDRYFAMQLAMDGMSGNRQLSDLHAARFLSQTTFGPTSASISYLKQVGIRTWLDEQMESVPASSLSDMLDAMYADLHGPRLRVDYEYNVNEGSDSLYRENVRTAFGLAAMGGEDQLRQRVAFILSQILVVSLLDANLEGSIVPVTEYYDFLMQNAFGNYRDILEYVTFSPCMGIYLSHVGNQKARPELNIYPDENYAREVMQLFTIGLWELNPDGSRKENEQGEPIPTYGQSEITEMARVLTGFWFAGQDFGEGSWSESSQLAPMELTVSKHDFGEKTIVGGYRIPAREPNLSNAYLDVQDALGALVDHPNTPVFVSKQLIQFLVTDNPSPGYIERVQDVFVDNGSGQRGDLGAVVRAILLDKEARNPIYFAKSGSSGFLKEPLVRVMHLGRVFKVHENSQFNLYQMWEFRDDISQDPLLAPSVFNFFRPDYRASGLLGEAGLVSPTFQILHSYSSVAMPRLLERYLSEGFMPSWSSKPKLPFDYSEFIPIEDEHAYLVERVNILFCGGMMNRELRDAIIDALERLDELEELPRGTKTQAAVWIAVTDAAGATQL